MHIEFLVEEYSAEVALINILPRIPGENIAYAIRTFSGKQDLLTQLPLRLKGYRKWKAQAYPRVPPTIGSKAPYRNPDAIVGGTWEALERVLQKAGYYPGGMPKAETAENISKYMDPGRNDSKSFQVFRDALLGLHL